MVDLQYDQVSGAGKTEVCFCFATNVFGVFKQTLHIVTISVFNMFEKLRQETYNHSQNDLWR